MISLLTLHDDVFESRFYLHHSS